MALSVALPLSGLETETFPSYTTFNGLRDILENSHSSPSPSISSDSSIIGSLVSLKSESISSDSVPASPQNVEKKSSTPVPVAELQVIYGGRNILDLGRNMDMRGWNATYADLPPKNATMFLNNRSQYFRVCGYRMEHQTSVCKECGFSYVMD